MKNVYSAFFFFFIIIFVIIIISQLLCVPSWKVPLMVLVWIRISKFVAREQMAAPTNI